MPVDATEKGLETIIVNCLRDANGYVEGDSSLYSKDEALAKPWLEAFLVATQPEKVARAMCFASPSEKAKFYARLDEALARRGASDLLRKGFAFNGTTFDLYYPLPSEQNPSAKEAYAQNRFGIIRQLHYSKTLPNDALDLAVFVNGIPLATFKLKNRYTGQTVQNAIRQYQTDRDPKEKLFRPKRRAVHFAVDDTDVFMCTELKGTDSWFLPFNRGVVATMGEEKLEFMQQYFANAGFRNFVNERVFRACVERIKEGYPIRDGDEDYGLAFAAEPEKAYGV